MTFDRRPTTFRATRRRAIGIGLGAAASAPLGVAALNAAPVSEAAPAQEAHTRIVAEAGQGPAQPPVDIRPAYRKTLVLLERLHRRQLDVIKDEFDRRGRNDITAHQALMLYNIADADLTVGEIRVRGYYLGPKLSSNVTRLANGGFLTKTRSTEDRRAVRVRLTEKGEEIHNILESVFARHTRVLEPVAGVSAADFQALNVSLVRVERFWTDMIRFRL